MRRLTTSWIALGLLLLLYFSVLAGPGLGSGFSHDDLMNLYFAWHQPIGKLVATNVQYWSDATRPLGALFYALFFDAFGLDPLPYRLFCFAILFCNIVLTLILVYRLTASQRAAVLATLLHCFHSNFTPLYYGSGSCYDVFAFFFFVSALTYYVGIRRAGRVPGIYGGLLISLLTVCALDAKEIAASLPLLIAAYEVCYHAPRRWSSEDLARWLFREGRTFLITGVVVSVFVVGKIAGSGAMIRQEAYAPHISVGAYLQSLTVMLNELVYSVSFFNATRVGGLLLGLLFIALAVKSKPLLFSWLYFVAGVLPVAFIAPRGLSSYYFPVLGLMVYLALLVDAIFKACERMAARQGINMRSRSVAVCGFLVLSLSLFRIHVRHGAFGPRWYWDEHEPIHETIRQLQV